MGPRAATALGGGSNAQEVESLWGSDRGDPPGGRGRLREVALLGRRRQCRNAIATAEEASREEGKCPGALPSLEREDEGVFPEIEIARGTTGGPRTRSRCNRCGLVNTDSTVCFAI